MTRIRSNRKPVRTSILNFDMNFVLYLLHFFLSVLKFLSYFLNYLPYDLNTFSH